MRNNVEVIDLIINICEENNISISELSRRVGMAKSAVSRYFNKSREFPINRIGDFANALGVTPEYLLGVDNTNKKEYSYRYFDLGVSAGFLESLDAKTTADDYICIPDKIMGKYSGRKSIILLRVNGDSMNRIIPHGSYIVVDTAKKRISDISDRDIIVFSDNNEYSVKRYINDRINQRFLFKPDSTEDIFTPIEVRYDNATNLKLIGKVVKYLVDLD